MRMDMNEAILKKRDGHDGVSEGFAGFAVLLGIGMSDDRVDKFMSDM